VRRESGRFRLATSFGEVVSEAGHVDFGAVDSDAFGLKAVDLLDAVCAS